MLESLPHVEQKNIILNFCSNPFCEPLKNQECNFDGGDCCGSCINTQFCTECYCFENIFSNAVPNALVGDNFCNDETNIAACNYDNGDCCMLEIRTDFCSECNCYDLETCATGFHPLVGDGFCDDEFNNANCNYDDGDCCGDVNTDFCSECICHLTYSCAAGYPPSSGSRITRLKNGL